MRISAPAVTYDGRGARTTVTITGDRGLVLEPWYRIPPGWPIDQTAAPFVPVGVALATAYEEDLEIETPVSTRLLAGANDAADLIAPYYGRRRPQIHGTARLPAPRPAGPRHVGLFLSRGVDSSANLVLGDRGLLDPKPTLAIVMAEMEPANTAAVDAKVVRRSLEAAAEFGLDGVPVATNLRNLLDHHITWIDVFGMVLAGAAIALSPRLDHAIISSAVGVQPLLLGAHRDLDPKWSTERVQFHHLPHGYDRSERIQLIVADGRPLAWLKVCTLGAVDNCGRCQKCVQTAALLEVFGVLDRTASFDRAAIDLEDLRVVPPNRVLLPDFLRAAQASRKDLVNALAREPERDAAGGVRRAAASQLHAMGSAQSEPEGDRRVPWCLLGTAGPAAEVAARAGAVWGPGLVWTRGALPRPLLDRVIGSAERTLWCGTGDAIDTDLVVTALALGSRPVQVVTPSAAVRLRAWLPTALRSLVASADELARLDDTAAPLDALSQTVAAGGTGWFVPPPHLVAVP